MTDLDKNCLQRLSADKKLSQVGNEMNVETSVPFMLTWVNAQRWLSIIMHDTGIIFEIRFAEDPKFAPLHEKISTLSLLAAT